MSSSTVSIGIIGCGGMGKIHAREFKRAGAHIGGLADPQLEVAEELKDEVEAELVVPDGGELIDNPDIDAVIISTHHDLHVPQCLAAAQAGKHFLIEKPLALTIEECEEVMRAADEACVKAMCGFQARFSPFCTTLREKIGKPLVLMAALTDPMWASHIWANDPKAGGGNILSQGCHMFDMMCYFAQGEPVTIHAEGGNFQHPDLPITDSLVATIRFDNGVIAAAVSGDYGMNPVLGKATYHLYAGNKVGVLAKYYGDATLEFWGAEPPRITGADLLPDDISPDGPGGWGGDAMLWLHGYCQQVAAFMAWLTDDIRHPDICGLEEGTRATRMATRCIDSIANETTVAY